MPNPQLIISERTMGRVEVYCYVCGQYMYAILIANWGPEHAEARMSIVRCADCVKHWTMRGDVVKL